jgi:hypothetical protein
MAEFVLFSGLNTISVTIYEFSCYQTVVTCSRLGSQPPIKTAGHLRLADAQGGTPTPQRAGRQKAAAARRGIELISALGKRYCPPATNPSDLLPLHIAKWECGRSWRRLYPMANGGVAIVSCIQRLTVGSRARQGGGHPPNARFVTEGEKLALSK